MDKSGALQAVRHLPAENVAAWREGGHRYIDEPLGLVIADLNRYATQRIVVEDPALEALRITTTFFSDDWQGWLDTLETAVPILQVRKAKNSVRIATKSETHGSPE